MKQTSTHDIENLLEGLPKQVSHVLSLRSFSTEGSIEFRANLTDKEAKKIAKTILKIKKKTLKAGETGNLVADEETEAVTSEEETEQNEPSLILQKGQCAMVEAYCKCTETDEQSTRPRIIFEEGGVIILADTKEYVICDNAKTEENQETFKRLFADITLVSSNEAAAFMARRAMEDAKNIKALKKKLKQMAKASEKVIEDLCELQEAVLDDFKLKTKEGRLKT